MGEKILEVIKAAGLDEETLRKLIFSAELSGVITNEWNFGGMMSKNTGKNPTRQDFLARRPLVPRSLDNLRERLLLKGLASPTFSSSCPTI
jgi:hypothetical protein